MYASIECVERTAAGDDELIRAGRQRAADLGRLPGFVAYLLLDGGDGQLMAVSVFEDNAGLNAAGTLPALGYRLEQRPAPRAPGQCSVLCGEVLVQKGL